MGFAVDVLADMGGRAWELAQAETGHHAQWEWTDPFGRYLALIGQGGAVADLARLQAELGRTLPAMSLTAGKRSW